MTVDPILRVRGLTKRFSVGDLGRRGELVAVDDVDLDVRRGETIALVGESGSGKSTFARCVLRLLEPTSGEVVFDGVDAAALGPRAVRALYRQMQMVFQDPSESLNPRLTVRDVLNEPLKLHLTLGRRAREQRVLELLELVGLGAEHLRRYPHQLSGGQRQRVGIARAIATNPSLVILDEPTSSLDMSVRRHVLRLLLDLQLQLELSYLLISHDLTVVRQVAQRVAVMYLGKIVEQGPTEEIFTSPRHPYTQALLSAVPRPAWAPRRSRLRLHGEIPSPLDLPAGCRLQSRCPLVRDECRVTHPEPTRLGGGHEVACHAVADDRAGTDTGPAPIAPLIHH